MGRLNRLLCEKSLPSQFATLFFFLLDQHGSGRFISAGHNPPYLFRSKLGNVEQLNAASMILGAFDFAVYEVTSFAMECGDILLVYSDGLTDAENLEGEMFGEDRLLEILQKEGAAGCDALELKLLQAVENFTRGHSQTDDITFMLVQKCV
jgi:sigma-B regulation protein RsbU (phosphoserine phosphatase)